MRKLVLLFALVGASSPVFASDEEDKEAGRDLGSVLGWRLGPEAVEERCRTADPEGSQVRAKALNNWQVKNAALIKSVDERVAQVAPLLLDRSLEEATSAVRAGVKAMLLDVLFAGRTPEEAKMICKAESNPAGTRWNNPGMPNVPISLAALYDWMVKRTGSANPKS